MRRTGMSALACILTTRRASPLAGPNDPLKPRLRYNRTMEDKSLKGIRRRFRTSDELDNELAAAPTVIPMHRSRKRGNPHITRAVLDDLKKRGKPIWERLSNESDTVYSQFSIYRDMGTTRSLDALALQLGYTSEQGLGLAPGSITQSSSDYTWQERVKAYDAWQRREQQAQEEIRTEVQVWVARTMNSRERKYRAGDLLAKMVERRLMLAGGLEELPDGSVKEVDPQPLRIADKDLPAFTRLAFNLMAQAISEPLAGEAASAAASSRGNNRDVIPLEKDLEEYSSDELDALISRYKPDEGQPVKPQ